MKRYKIVFGLSQEEGKRLHYYVLPSISNEMYYWFGKSRLLLILVPTNWLITPSSPTTEKCLSFPESLAHQRHDSRVRGVQPGECNRPLCTLPCLSRNPSSSLMESQWQASKPGTQAIEKPRKATSSGWKATTSLTERNKPGQGWKCENSSVAPLRSSLYRPLA